MWNLQQSRTVVETYPLNASQKLILLRHWERLYQWTLLQWIRCTARLVAALSYSVKPFTGICLRLVDDIAVRAQWMSFKNAASLSKSVFKLGLCYVDQKFFVVDGRSIRKGENWFWTGLCVLTALFLVCLRHAKQHFTKCKGYFPLGLIGAFLCLMAWNFDLKATKQIQTLDFKFSNFLLLQQKQHFVAWKFHQTTPVEPVLCGLKAVSQCVFVERGRSWGDLEKPKSVSTRKFLGSQNSHKYL